MIPDDIIIATVDPGGGKVDTGILRHAERIIGRAEMMMDLAELTEVSTVELGGDAVTTESMQHTQKITQHAMAFAEMVMQFAEMGMRLKEHSVEENDYVVIRQGQRLSLMRRVNLSFASTSAGANGSC